MATAVALLAFAWSLHAVPTGIDPLTYYEVLFWGGGHALQFVWTLLMLVAWLWLAGALGARVPLSPRLTVLMFVLALACVFVTPYAYLAHPIASVEHRHLHTWAMRLGGGVSIVPIGLAVLVALMRCDAPRTAAGGPLRTALLGSMLLFAAGGMIGVFISGNNVKIPAHYHGCIVGVTLALMGLVYLLLPKLGYRAPGGRLATWQPALYGFGQLLHIIGLVWSGGYGVPRKVAGAEQVLRTPSEIAGMGLMGPRRPDRHHRRVAVRGRGPEGGARHDTGAGIGGRMIGWLQRPLRAAFMFVEGVFSRAFGGSSIRSTTSARSPSTCSGWSPRAD